MLTDQVIQATGKRGQPMKREDVIQLAREAGCGHEAIDGDWILSEGIETIERLIHLATEKAVTEEKERMDVIEANAVAEIARQRTENAQLTAERDQLRAQLAKAVASKCELLESLGGLLEITDFHELYGGKTEAARAAIAKATGETYAD